ncbi:MAG: polysaccharide biosynthesis/export family protein [Planctomycetota bacterium]|jgi:hypothetical protein|nr:polysaccharide biosynthesis/export family protein [Planctomycetota bacterium]
MRFRNSVLIMAAALLPALPACGSKKAPAYSPSIPAADLSGEAHWREVYRKRRPVPPESFTVPPKSPRDNSFGEFADGLHAGLDAQPDLPALPADAYPPPRAAAPSYDGGAGRTRPQASYYDPSFTPPATGGYSPPSPAAAAAGTVAAANAAAALPRYVPVEQLIYGGGYGDVDRPDEYRLMPKDVVTFTVRDHPEFSGTAEIQADGTVRIPNAHDIVAIRGLTADMAAEEIRKTLLPYVLGECAVRVQANRARGGYYHVHGDVLQPGRFPMGMEPVKLSEAILAANWEANPSRQDIDGDDLSPSFPAAAPRGRYVSPQSADLARVMLVTPHRSRPSRTVHDVRGAFLGRTGDDPIVRPGQIVIVPSLLPERNALLGLDPPPPAELPEKVFSGPGTPARLPGAAPPPPPSAPSRAEPAMSDVEANMTATYDAALTGPGTAPDRRPTGSEYLPYGARVVKGGGGGNARRNRLSGW